MIPIDGQPILTAAAMRTVEERAAPTQGDVYIHMTRAAAGVANAVRRLAGGADVLVLCGPGNNGGVGLIAARLLSEQGCTVRIAALGPPRTIPAKVAAHVWGGTVALYTAGDDPSAETEPWECGLPQPAPVVVDALFGAGGRKVGHDERWMANHRPLFELARTKIAVDLPVGLTADGMCVPADEITHADVTLALGALRPAHVLPSSVHICGEVRIIDTGLDLSSITARINGRPTLKAPAATFSKFDRGVVGIIAGAMPGAAHLAATAAARAGAGYVVLFGDAPGGPDAIVRRPLTDEALQDDRISAFVIGPGLGRDEQARRWLDKVLSLPLRTVVLDADALRLLDVRGKHSRLNQVILTPHHGEFQHLAVQLCPEIDAAVDAAEPFAKTAALARVLTDHVAVVVHKGSTTVMSDGRRMRVSPRGNAWLSTAGTGDVLAGTIGAMAADRSFNGKPLIEAAAAGVWLHAEAARRCGASFIADDLAAALTPARASL